MTLVAGTRLGAYEILAPIGAGGMGEVYRARDTRLERTVAVKVLPERIAQDPDLRERFEREAKTISSLNHPHICTLHDVGRENGVDFLVLEYIEGETLAARLAQKGALPLDEVFRNAIEIAEALEKAHRAGVIHRDLKPGNVMLTRTGVKLLDFGLARLRPGFGEAGPGESVLTVERPLTQKGTILGTVQYMAPEQLEGKEADARTDLFAFGALVYEMATGKRAFEGKSPASLIAAILEREPAPMAPLAPPALERLVKKCLAKDPEERWHSAHDLAEALRWIRAGAAEAVERRRKTASPAVLVGAGIAIGAVLATVGLLALRGEAESSGVVRFAVVLPESQTFFPGLSPVIAISPDGRAVAYRANDQIFLRELDQLQSRSLPGTEGEPTSLAFSPDGQWIAFNRGVEILKSALGGGVPIKVCETGTMPFGVVWGSDDVLRWGTSSRGVFEVPANGGIPKPTFPSHENWRFTWRPLLMPDRRTLLYVEGTGTLTARTLGGGEPQVLTEGVEDFRYAPSGHIVYSVASGDLLAARFDSRRLELGRPAPVAGGVNPVQFDVSRSGALFYAPSDTTGGSLLVWVDRNGVVTPAVEDRQPFSRPRISPDGRRVAVEVQSPETSKDVWVYDLERGTRTRVTTEPSTDQDPVWRPDGRHLVYGARGAIHLKSADGSGETESLATSDLAKEAHSFSPDGRALAYYVHTEVESRDIWILPMEGERTPVEFLATPFNERSPSFSADGRFLAYVSDASGRDEVYVQPYPGPGPREVLSTTGGRQPVWSRDGRELFYRNEDRMMAVAIETDPVFRAGVPELLFEGRFLSERPTSGSQSYDVSSDGRRFLMVQSDDEARELYVVLNWHEELLARIP